MLFPVFAKVRERARQASCQSNEKQIGLGLIQYFQDNDETFPGGAIPGAVAYTPGIDPPSSGGTGAGAGWAGEIFPYLKSAQIFKCPDDTTSGGTNAGYTSYPVSYTLNGYLPKRTLALLAAPATTVMIYEGTTVKAYVTLADEGISEGVAPGQLSAVGDGYGYTNGGPGSDSGSGFSDMQSGITITAGVPALAAAGSGAQDATGGLNARHDPQASNQGGSGELGAESGGSEYLMADGHVKLIKLQSVYAGGNPHGNDSLSNGCPMYTTYGQPCVATFNPLN